MQRLPPVLRLAALLAGGTALAGGGDDVYRQTAHGDVSTGVLRVGTTARGHCAQCHPSRQVAPFALPHALFAANDNGLCFTCHGAAGALGVYQGQPAFLSTAHWQSGRALWPGPVPAPRPAGDEGTCLNCHSPHGVRDSQGLVPALGLAREEALCLACHDGNGPSLENIAQEVGKANAHAQAPAARHAAAEGLAPAAFGVANRHSECVDCHNPHRAQAGAGSALVGVSRVSVTNGAAGTPPTFTALPASDASPVSEYQLCFKCHSSWTTLPPGARDKALEFNPNSESFHPVEAAGKNQTAKMNASLAGGTGLPHLTSTSRVTCTDCHASEAIPLSVSRASTYTGAVPRGPHGSNAASGSPALASSILRASYRTELKAANSAYNAADFTLCFICHAAAPFADGSKNTRADTNFRHHGFHMGRLGGDRNAVCKECHEDLHGTRGALQASNRSYARLVSFTSNVTGRSGTGAPVWSAGSCSMRCHGKGHDNETY